MKSQSDKAGPSMSPLSRSHGRFDYDVFLSFRGEDTRHNFAGLLGDMLYLQGIHAFFDEEDLHKGQRIEEILEAISRSKILVPIFSQRYAESKWCLREVAKMVESCHHGGQERLIIPIFFDVNPADVRYQSGPFGSAFQKHETKSWRDSFGEVDGWKHALRYAGGISGFHLKNGNQRELIKSIVAEIQKVLPADRLLDEGEYVVGLEHRVKEMMKRLDFQAKDVRIIGVHGIGGIGKTTLAKAVYNRSHRFFEASSFIENVREESKSKGLVQLQKQLIQDISKGKHKKRINNISQGTQMIMQMVGTKSILLVLDDVNEQEQLDALARKISWFHTGSRIIITTRQVKILKLAGLPDEAVYMVEELDEKESLQLFNYHACGDEESKQEYTKLSKEVVSISNGLPLILQVFGSLFKTAETPEEWNKLLEDLRVRQDSKVHEKLRICYDSMNDNEKLIFLDIACLLVRKNVEDAIYMWEDHNLSPNVAIRSLQNRSLVRINKGKFEMHDQIRDMGREIVLRESLFLSRNRSRLWRERDIVESLRNSQRTMTEGIILNLREGSDTRLSTEAFELISELRILLINSAIFGNCDFRHFPASLKWLEWKGCPLETFPLESKFKSVVVLNLSRSFIGQLWSEATLCSKSTKELYEGLKVLDLSCCDCLNCTPNFAVAPNLKKLILDDCSNLKEVDDSIGFLKKLVFLSMRECVSLEKLPNKIYELSSLAVFNLEGCHRLVGFPQFLAGSDSAVDLHLVVSNQPTSRQLTNFINGLSNLKELILRDCESLEFLPRLYEFHSLRSLHIDGCQGLNHIRKYLFENVAVREWDELSVSGSETQSSRQEFSFMLPIGSINDPLLLQQLQCHGYGDPCEKGTMTLHVRYEDMANNWSTSDIILQARCDHSIYEDNVYGYGYTICFGRSDQINEAPRGETVIMKVTTVNNCKLTKVDIKLQKSSRFSGENMMKPYLSISRRETFMSPPTSVNPSSSRKIEFEFSTFFSAYQADKLEVIEYPAALDARITQMMWQLRAQCGEQMFHFAWTIEELIILTLIFGDAKVSWYEQWHGTVLPRQARDRVYDKMKVLDISHCRFLVRTPDFARTPNLEKLILDHCGSLLEVGESIGQLKKLILLNITRCAKLLALPCAILQLNSLRVLSLAGCSAIKFPLETCSRKWNSRMMHVGLEALQELVLDYCTSLRGIPYYVGGLQCLRRLSLRGCYSLASLPLSIGSLVVLEELNVAECSKLFSIPALEKLRSLKILHMNGCDHLDLEQIHRQLKVFQDLEAFSISIATSNVANTSFLSLIDLGKSSRISFPFPRGGRVGREPLYVEQINVAIGGTLDYGKINLEIKTTEENVLHVDALPLSKRSSRGVSKFEPEQLSAKTQALVDKRFYERSSRGVSKFEPEQLSAKTQALVAPVYAPVNCYTSRFRMDDEVNERLRVEAAASTDDATSVGMLHVSCTEPSFSLQRGDIWFRQPLTPKFRGLRSPEDDGTASKKPKIEGSP